MPARRKLKIESPGMRRIFSEYAKRSMRSNLCQAELKTKFDFQFLNRQ